MVRSLSGIFCSSCFRFMRTRPGTLRSEEESGRVCMIEDFLDQRSKSMSVCWKEDDQSLFLIGSGADYDQYPPNLRSRWTRREECFIEIKVELNRFSENKLVSMGAF